MKLKTIIILNLFFLMSFNKAFAAESYSFNKENGLYILKMKNNDFIFEPYVADKLETVKEIEKKTDAFAIINGGFFDPKNCFTASFVTIHSKIAANPYDNKDLVENPELKPYIDKILNRSEFRVMNCYGQTRFEIAKHNEILPMCCKLVHSLQAGPEIYPQMPLEDEFFVLKQNGKIIRQSAGVLTKTARAAIGIKNHYVYIIATDENLKLSIYEFTEKINKLKLDKVMAVDGGSSVSLFVNILPQPKFITGLSDGGSRKIKSALIVKKANKKEL